MRGVIIIAEYNVAHLLSCVYNLKFTSFFTHAFYDEFHGDWKLKLKTCYPLSFQAT